MAVDALDDDADLGDLSRYPRKRFSGKKLVLFIILPLLLVTGAIVGALTTGALDALVRRETAAQNAEPAPGGPAVFYPLPDMVVNLNSAAGRSRFLKLSVSLELTREDDIAVLQRIMPRIIDNFQVYLRELKIEDLKGSAGLYRLRKELLLRVNGASGGVARQGHPVPRDAGPIGQEGSLRPWESLSSTR